MYVNGNQITAFGTANYPAQNAVSQLTSANANNSIGAGWSGFEYFDGYMDDIYFVDGQALEPYFFGNNDANGVWKPIQYRGTYGTNGFYLNFSNTTSTTTLGNDSSGNGNNWTTNNISLTAGVTYDAMTDVPTNTSATTANYCTLNPLNKNTNATVSNANLTVTTAITNAGISGTIYMPSTGKYYWEATCTTRTNYPIVGIVNIAWSSGTNALTYPGATSGSYGYANDGTKYNNGSNTSYGASYTSGDIIGVAYDADTGTLTFYKNNTSQGAAYTGLTDIYAPAVSGQGSDVWNMNFGQRPFAYTPPTGFVALNTFNLPTPTILQGNRFMDATLWTGNGASTNIITNQGQFRPDFVWIKQRSGTEQHQEFDSIRGATKVLNPNLTNAESTDVTKLTAFNSNGFSLGSELAVNGSGSTYVGWQWQAGSSTVTNTSGSISAQVRANTTAGFSIVTYTGTGANATVGHGLGVAPAMVIVKRINSTGNWQVRHTSIAAANSIQLNLTNASASATTVWNSTTPTSTVFSIGTSTDVNANTGTYVAYCWAAIAGFSAFGSYTGNGSADGTFVYLGFRPEFIMVKKTNTGNSWVIEDASRSPFNVVDDYLAAEGSAAESTTSQVNIDFLSNGFKLRSAFDIVNAGDYIYMAFAEHPFKNSNAR
jgi:hypothetical protein